MHPSVLVTLSRDPYLLYCFPRQLALALLFSIQLLESQRSAMQAVLRGMLSCFGVE